MQHSCCTQSPLMMANRLLWRKPLNWPSWMGLILAKLHGRSILASRTELGRWPEGLAKAMIEVKGSEKPPTVPEALQMMTGQEVLHLYNYLDPKSVNKDNVYLQLLHPTKFLRKPLIFQIKENSKTKDLQARWPYERPQL